MKICSVPAAAAPPPRGGAMPARRGRAPPSPLLAWGTAEESVSV
jgi:hypothetical protein